MRAITGVTILLALLAGCAAFEYDDSGYRRIRSPDAAAWFSVTCQHGIGNCYDRAGTLCVRGYTVQATGAGDERAQVIRTQTSSFVVTHRTDELIIRCRIEP